MCMCCREGQSFNWTWKCKLYIFTLDMFMSRKAFLSACSLQLLSRVSCAFIYDMWCACVDKTRAHTYSIAVWLGSVSELKHLCSYHPRKMASSWHFWIGFSNLKTKKVKQMIEVIMLFIMTLGLQPWIFLDHLWHVSPPFIGTQLW